jgi:hypothetical protein
MVEGSVDAAPNAGTTNETNGLWSSTSFPPILQWTVLVSARHDVRTMGCGTQSEEVTMLVDRRTTTRDVATPAAPSKGWETPEVRSPRTAIAFTALFAIASVVKALTHEIWQDEAQAWLIARASSDPIDVVGNLRGEGHPMLWHLVLWVATRFTHDPLAMQLISAALATVAAYLVVRHAPLPRPVAMAMMLGALPFFVYNTVARTYALELALFAYAGLLTLRRPRSPRALAVVLGLACFTTLYAVVVAAVCWAVVLLDEVVADGWSALKRWVPASLGLVVAGGAAALQALAPASSYKDRVIADAAAGKADGGPRAVFDVFFAGLEWVATDLITSLQQSPMVFALIVGVLFLAVALAIADRPAALVGWGGASVAVIVALAFTGLSAPHHRGQLFFAVLFGVFFSSGAARWPAQGPLAPIASFVRLLPQRLARATVAACFVAGAAIGLAVSWRDIQEPFVPWTAATDVLRDAGLADAPFVVLEPGRTSPILAHLDRTAVMAWSWTEGDFAPWNDRTDRTDAEVFAGARALAASAGRDAVVVADAPMTDVPPDVVLLARVDVGFRTEPDDADRDVAYLYLVPATDGAPRP